MDLLIQNQSVRLNIIGNRECLSLPKENQKLRENDENQEKLALMEKFRNVKSLFLTEFKSFKNEFLQSCVKHSLSEKVHGNSASEISERFINHLKEQISFLREQLRNKDKIINSLIAQLSKNSEVIETPVINQQDKNLFLKTAEENTTPVKEKLSHNTETTNNRDLNTSVIKTSNVDFTIEKSDEIETDLPNNTNKINPESENKQVIRKNNDIKTQKSVIILGDSMVKHINGWEISKRLQSDCKVYVKQFSGARTKCMKDYMKPSLRENPDHFILHVGTIDLNKERSPELIAKSIVDLATTLKGNSRYVSVANIIVRTDNSNLNEKGCEENAHLTEMYKERKLNLINHSKKIKLNHLN